MNLTVVSVKGWFSNEETPGQLRRIYWGGGEEGEEEMERQQNDKERGWGKRGEGEREKKEGIRKEEE